MDEIAHPAIRNAMKLLDMHQIRLTYEADLPARSGLGTSSSFAVGMLNAFYALKGQYASKQKLAADAIYLERVLCAETGGWQDQIAASFGGFNRINFSTDGYEVKPVLLSQERKKRLNGNLMMFFTGFTRFSADVQQFNCSHSAANKTALLREMMALVDDAEAILVNEQADLDEFGRLLDHTWQLKRHTGAAVSTDCIDELYANGYGKAGDVLLAISTSGKSKNILYASVTARAIGMKVIGLTGAADSPLIPLCDVCIRAPLLETYQIQELHLPIYHCLCLMLEEHFFCE